MIDFIARHELLNNNERIPVSFAFININQKLLQSTSCSTNSRKIPNIETSILTSNLDNNNTGRHFWT